jgi:hypothetical protein
VHMLTSAAAFPMYSPRVTTEVQTDFDRRTGLCKLSPLSSHVSLLTSPSLYLTEDPNPVFQLLLWPNALRYV